MAKTTDTPDEKPDEKPVRTAATTVTAGGKRVDIKDTGLSAGDSKGRLVEVMATSYLNGALFEPGAITHWPEGVEALGPNLREYKR